jgi:TFIIF-interacting CTD phosphatase-like protein
MPIKHIILDLDETLIHGVPLDDPQGITEDQLNHMRQTLKYHIMDDRTFIIFERPHLREFLNRACSLAHVSVWTAATQSYGSFIIKQIFNSPSRHCYAFFHREHCEQSEAATGHKKSLSWLAHHCPSLYSDANQMIIVDDNRDVEPANPNNCILIDEFFGNENDRALFALTDLLDAIVH